MGVPEYFLPKWIGNGDGGALIMDLIVNPLKIKVVFDNNRFLPPPKP